ncbi:hypothetical protein [Solirubrobacter soli]|uniref:hypothetical protein n=1 Tax=Solirubrobacter soli TaxID=363832 RepID=UPI0004031D43|nr:hypothetical protein [Solirubrobacter soli]
MAGAGGVALIASLFLPWYEVADVAEFSGWDAFATLDVVLVGCAVAAIGGSARFAGPAAWIALLVVATRLTTPGTDIGVWVALAASLLLFARAEVPDWRPQREDAIALAGGVLVFASLFTDWHGIDALSAWAVLELTPVAATVATVIAIVRRSTPAAIAVVALVGYALFTTSDPRYGGWLGLAGAVILLVGTLRNDRLVPA